jgi:hypothetical protein
VWGGGLDSEGADRREGGPAEREREIHSAHTQSTAAMAGYYYYDPMPPYIDYGQYYRPLPPYAVCMSVFGWSSTNLLWAFGRECSVELRKN